jgi:hypothetical protein
MFATIYDRLEPKTGLKQVFYEKLTYSAPMAWKWLNGR